MGPYRCFYFSCFFNELKHLFQSKCDKRHFCLHFYQPNRIQILSKIKWKNFFQLIFTRSLTRLGGPTPNHQFDPEIQILLFFLSQSGAKHFFLSVTLCNPRLQTSNHHHHMALLINLNTIFIFICHLSRFLSHQHVYLF